MLVMLLLYALPRHSAAPTSPAASTTTPLWQDSLSSPPLLLSCCTCCAFAAGGPGARRKPLPAGAQHGPRLGGARLDEVRDLPRAGRSCCLCKPSLASRPELHYSPSHPHTRPLPAAKPIRSLEPAGRLAAELLPYARALAARGGYTSLARLQPSSWSRFWNGQLYEQQGGGQAAGGSGTGGGGWDEQEQADSLAAAAAAAGNGQVAEADAIEESEDEDDW